MSRLCSFLNASHSAVFSPVHQITEFRWGPVDGSVNAPSHLSWVRRHPQRNAQTPFFAADDQTIKTMLFYCITSKWVHTLSLRNPPEIG